MWVRLPPRVPLTITYGRPRLLAAPVFVPLGLILYLSNRRCQRIETGPLLRSLGSAQVSKQHGYGFPTGDFHNYAVRNASAVSHACERAPEIVEAGLAPLAVRVRESLRNSQLAAKLLEVVEARIVAQRFAFRLHEHPAHFGVKSALRFQDFHQVV